MPMPSVASLNSDARCRHGKSSAVGCLAWVWMESTLMPEVLPVRSRSRPLRPNYGLGVARLTGRTQQRNVWPVSLCQGSLCPRPDGSNAMSMGVSILTAPSTATLSKGDEFVRGHCHTVLGQIVGIPDEFVAPSRSNQVAKQRSKHRAPSEKQHESRGSSRIYCKHATDSDPTGESPDKKSSRGTRDPSSGKASTKNHRAKPTSPSAPHPEPVDFVYDVRVRSRLREEIDRERSEVREAALAREAQLRAEHRWIADSAEARKPAKASRKEAWASEPPPQGRPANSSRQGTGAQAASARSSSARSRRSTASSSAAATGKKSKPPSTGPHISDWQHQTAPRSGASREALEHQRKQQRQRESERQREAQSVAETIDAFERSWVF